MKRADVLLVERGLTDSRSRAQRLIREGKVCSAAGLVEKPSQSFPDDAELRVTLDDRDRFVSRGGIKLDAALTHSSLDVSGWSALDIGASTGGFTDCLLQAGAARVVCVDVGHDQLAATLRDDCRVHNYEGVNARELPANLLDHAPGGYDLIVMDVSFISQTKILAGLAGFLKPGGWLISLVKPQFEVGRDKVGKGGIVRDPSLFATVESAVRACCERAGFDVRGYIDSPIAGGDGNREFLLIAGFNK